MTSMFGWIDFSDQDLRAARRLLANEDAGVRDELGLLAVHTGYAERFFPGTSVLQTRLRYAFFVPWIYQSCARDRSGRSLADRLEARELELARALKGTNERGVIGDTLVDKGRSPAQPPTFVYWSMLRRWGLLQLAVTHSSFHRQFASLVATNRRTTRDDEGVPLGDTPTVWHASLPEPPTDDWIAKATFRLRRKEVEFLRRRIQAIEPRPGSPRTCLLQALVEQEISPGRRAFWANESVLEVAGSERAIVERAGHAAGFVAIMRALYNAHVERALGERGAHFARLGERLEEHLEDSRRFDLEAMRGDFQVGGVLLKFLANVRALVVKARRPDDLLAAEIATLLAVQERRRKGPQARLGGSPTNERNRRLWADEGRAATTAPLDYRWFRVHQLLADLVASGENDGA